MDYDNTPLDLSNPLWEDPDFPNFYTNQKALLPFEDSFKEDVTLLRESDEATSLKVEELYSSFKIEGIELDRNSLRDSLTQNLSKHPLNGHEKGALDLLEIVLEHKNKPLSHELIQEMNRVLLSEDSTHAKIAGEYVGDMLIVEGGRIDRRTIIERGVPKERVHEEMEKFITWYNERDKNTPLQNALQGHLHFEKIHPFADGNGRIGRALMNMSLMSDLNLTNPLAISKGIRSHQKKYYESFEVDKLDLTDYLKSSSQFLSRAIRETRKIVALTELRANLYKSDLNDRQKNALNKVISKEISSEFEGAINNKKYRKLSNTDEKTAQRDLAALTQNGFLQRSGKLKGTKYKIELVESLRNEQHSSDFLYHLLALRKDASQKGAVISLQEKTTKAIDKLLDVQKNFSPTQIINITQKSHEFVYGQLGLKELKTTLSPSQKTSNFQLKKQLPR